MDTAMQPTLRECMQQNTGTSKLVLCSDTATAVLLFPAADAILQYRCCYQSMLTSRSCVFLADRAAAKRCLPR
jgi:hypothetical protein